MVHVLVHVMVVLVNAGVTGTPLEGRSAAEPARACVESTTPDAVLETLTVALMHEPVTVMRRTLDAVEAPVRRAAAAAPDDAAAQYRLAALLGVRAERESGRAKVSAAGELHTQSQRVLAIDPQHAGAHYLAGRLHAGIMRLDGVTRFIATRLLGGEALRGASWDESQRHLEAAERLAPCAPMHHYDLARLYADRGRFEEAERERQHALALVGAQPFWASVRARAERLPDSWRSRR